MSKDYEPLAVLDAVLKMCGSPEHGLVSERLDELVRSVPDEGLVRKLEDILAPLLVFPKVREAQLRGTTTTLQEAALYNQVLSQIRELKKEYGQTDVTSSAPIEPADKPVNKTVHVRVDHGQSWRSFDQFEFQSMGHQGGHSFNHDFPEFKPFFGEVDDSRSWRSFDQLQFQPTGHQASRSSNHDFPEIKPFFGEATETPTRCQDSDCLASPPDLSRGARSASGDRWGGQESGMPVCGDSSESEGTSTEEEDTAAAAPNKVVVYVPADVADGSTPGLLMTEDLEFFHEHIGELPIEYCPCSKEGLLHSLCGETPSSLEMLGGHTQKDDVNMRFHWGFDEIEWTNLAHVLQGRQEMPQCLFLNMGLREIEAKLLVKAGIPHVVYYKYEGHGTVQPPSRLSTLYSYHFLKDMFDPRIPRSFPDITAQVSRSLLGRQYQISQRYIQGLTPAGFRVNIRKPTCLTLAELVEHRELGSD